MASATVTPSSYGPGDTDVIGARIVAQIVDFVAILVLGFALGVGVGMALRSEAGVFIGFIGATLAYGTILEGAYGKTLGKMLMNIRVVDRNGDEIGYAKAFVRNIPALFGGWLTWIVGIAAIAISDRDQRLFDQLAETYVVRT